MKRYLVIILAMLPCLLFGQTQEVPGPEELDKTLDSSLAPGELVKKPVVKKAKKKKKKKIKKKKVSKKKSTKKIIKNTGVQK